MTFFYLNKSIAYCRVSLNIHRHDDATERERSMEIVPNTSNISSPRIKSGKKWTTMETLSYDEFIYSQSGSKRQTSRKHLTRSFSYFPVFFRNMNSPCGCQALANIISRFDSLSSIPRWCHNAICHRRIDTERHHHSPSWNAYPRGAFSIINRPVFAARRGIGMRERERENRPPSSRHPRK